jgi:GNAT superfamily N-acetyltransferase
MAVLRDGSEVIIRQLTPADAPMLAAAFERLSDESRELRFLGGKTNLSATDLAYLTDVDGHAHEALGGLDARTGQGVGVARFVRLAPEGRVAEVAVTVIDAWQGRGLGTLLLEELTERARAEGIERYTALVSGENTAVVALLHHIGAEVRHDSLGSGAVEYEVEIAPTGLGHSLRAALRVAASGGAPVPHGIAEALRALAHQLHLTDAESWRERDGK